MLTNARVATNLPLKGYSISEILIFGLKLQESGSIATERRPRISRSICHGITRKRHGNKQKQRHGRKKKQKHLPRINTELHGKDTEIRTRTSRSICHGLTRNYTEISRRLDREGRHIFQSRMSERRLHSSFRCKIQRFKWRSCSGASPSQLLCL